MKYAFAGDREISLNILKFLISKGYKPAALFVSKNSKSSHSEELIALAGLDKELVFEGNDFKGSLDIIKSMELDYIFGIHFPYIIPNEFLKLPKIGFLNLHPAFLPFNKGWHTPSWAIIDGTKFGATIHFMSEMLDKGNIIYQKELIVQPSDTANTLYQKALKLEEEVFYEAFDDLAALRPKSLIQIDKGTSHSRKDLKEIQEIKLNEKYSGKEIIDRLRGLSTNKIEEGAYFVLNGERYYMQVSISKES
ncbi:formyltransferase family protein [Aequorivita lipolytica]|uniref:Formyl transferase N-terminal domain-containing protein n=1 Tax=Aequorivita lipolytica TaxID=153267 RepID=A0A5C6YKI0_9FLAO|nr:formyltransferase family protein [Aequorivita lipolytica]TXD67870.1 hypothetical protein ESV24_14805 [Aequorivita lipolytica]SRX51206.1 Methionyl-tRNA formyltransferase [Aequorivita lipolytica]